MPFVKKFFLLLFPVWWVCNNLFTRDFGRLDRYTRRRDAFLTSDNWGTYIGADDEAQSPAALTDTRPFFILHVGLHKTGTTAIQRFMTENEQALLEMDNYKSLTIQNSDLVKGIRFCFLQEKFDRIPMNRTCYESNLDSLLDLGANGTNILLSQEDFSSFDFSTESWKTLYQTLQEHFRVRVVVYYRRHFERLASVRNQMYKWVDGDARTNGRRNLLTLWPQEGGIATPTFSSYFSSTVNRDITDLMRMPARGKAQANRIFNVLYQLGEQSSYPIMVRNFHCEDVLEDFFCYTVPNADQTCQSLQNNTLSDTDLVNPSVDDHDYDIIALEAKKQGLLQRTVTRGQVKDRAKEYQEMVLNMTVHDLPQVCLTPTQQEELRNLSYAIEMLVMPSMNETHDEAFTKAAGKFCSVDAPLVLQDEGWRTVLGAIVPLIQGNSSTSCASFWDRVAELLHM